MTIQLIRRKVTVKNKKNQVYELTLYLCRVKETGQQIKYSIFKFRKKLLGLGYILNQISTNILELNNNDSIIFEYNIDYTL